MKNQVFIGLIALIALCFSGCESNGPQFHKDTFDMYAESAHWEYLPDIKQYFYHFDVPALTERVYNYGEISVNHEYNPGTPNKYQVALPETIYNGDYIEHLNYAYGPGFVEIFYTMSDFAYPDDFSPGDLLFRLQMTY